MASVSQIERWLAQKNVRPICRALKDRNIQVRRRAAQALSELELPEAVPHLVRALTQEIDQYVLNYSMEALGKIGNTAAVDALIVNMFSSNRHIARLAEQELAQIENPIGQIAIDMRGVILHSDWQALSQFDEHAGYVLGLLMQSQQYDAWPAAKRREVAKRAVVRKATPSRGQSQELAEMGLYVSGVHTLGDLLRGLRDQNPTVRIAAAEKLGASKLQMASGQIYRRFRKEVKPGGNLQVAAAMGRALDQLDDTRALDYYRAQFVKGDTTLIDRAAHGLAEIGTPQAIEMLFQHAVKPPPALSKRVIQAVHTALENLGPRVLDTLRPMIDHEDAVVRRASIEMIARSRHPESTMLLGYLARDEVDSIQDAAIEALARMNSTASALLLRDLVDFAPREKVIAALARITDPAGPQYMRALVHDSTTIRGYLLGTDGKPVGGASVQVVVDQSSNREGGWGWRPLSPRAETDVTGRFSVSLFEYGAEHTPRIKVIMPRREDGSAGATYITLLAIKAGWVNQVQVRLDGFFNDLVIQIDQVQG